MIPANLDAGEEDFSVPALPFVQLPPSTHVGRYRNNPEDCQIEAKDDLAAVRAWLKERARRSPATFESYRKEAERLVYWAAWRGKSLSDIAREDMADYDSFLRNPSPEEFWVNRTGGKGIPRHSPDWRPFRGPLSDASRATTFNVLRALFSYLHSVGYLRLNVMSKSALGKDEKVDRRQKLRHRYLHEEVWAWLQGFLEAVPEDDREKRHRARARWVLALLYETGARRSELAAGTMGDFFLDPKGGVWLTLTGKGNKTRDIPLPSYLLTLCAEYRQSLDLSPTPLPGDSTPLVLTLSGAKGVSDEVIYRIAKDSCYEAGEAMKATDPFRAESLMKATTHWLRHTKATHLTKHADILSVSKFLGHDSVKTTADYQHLDDAHLYEQLVKSREASSGYD